MSLASRSAPASTRILTDLMFFFRHATCNAVSFSGFELEFTSAPASKRRRIPSMWWYFVATYKAVTLAVSFFSTCTPSLLTSAPSSITVFRISAECEKLDAICTGNRPFASWMLMSRPCDTKSRVMSELHLETPMCSAERLWEYLMSELLRERRPARIAEISRESPVLTAAVNAVSPSSETASTLHSSMVSKISQASKWRQ
mmetsp:Transcript_33384/g.53674  ORF Transcript_33384/g.53674 Transcript_33384/m.53674 type:complete len:201 (-) Transcript_33384:772-1374(-)